MIDKSREELLLHIENVIASYIPIELGAAVSPADAFFCYRILLGRMPSIGTELQQILKIGGTTYREFLNNLLASEEFSKRGTFIPSNHRFMVELPRFRFWFRTEDREMGVMMGTGQYEPETIRLLSRIVKKGDTCMDIGAQTGFISMHLASLVGPMGNVYSMEPMRDSFEILSKNIYENHFENIVSAQQIACSDHAGEKNFLMHSGMLIATIENTGENIIGVKSIPADDIPNERVSFVKLDVEGHEPIVLAGMSRILKNDRPIILTEVNEYWLRRAGSSGHAYMRQLAEYDYILRRAEDASIIEIGDIRLNELDSINILVIPSERDEEVTCEISNVY